MCVLHKRSCHHKPYVSILSLFQLNRRWAHLRFIFIMPSCTHTNFLGLFSILSGRIWMLCISHHSEYIFLGAFKYDTSGSLNARGHLYSMYVRHTSKGRESAKKQNSDDNAMNARREEEREKLKRNSNNDEVKLYPPYNQILTRIEDGEHIKFHHILRACI